MSIDTLIDGIIGREGGYSNNPNDTGGETMWGITARVARANGYSGSMKAMPRQVAKEIYIKRYVLEPGFASVIPLSEPVAEELVDTGVNMGTAIAAIFFQQALNALNTQAKDYADILEDGDIGPKTVATFQLYLKKRGKDGEKVMLRALNCLQGARYIELARTRSANETFLYGWLRNRVA